MSKLESNEGKLREVADAAKRSFKCRIPQRLPSGRQRIPLCKTKTFFNNKAVVLSSQQPRFAAKPGSRPRSGEPPLRPERERLLPAQKQNTYVIPKRAMNNNNIPTNKSTRPVIKVPVSQKQHTKTLYTNRTLTCLPDQETIDRYEDLELQQSDLESITSRKEKLNISWQEKSIQFEKLKNELNEKQKVIAELYASMGVTHKKMSALGQKTSLPSLEKVHILDAANLTPELMLQLCANENFLSCNQLKDGISSTTPFSTDRLYNMPSKLVNTCEQTLDKNKEIINELEALLSSPDKCINLKSLLKKIKDFDTQNEMLSCSFDKIKNDFMIELNDIVSFIRRVLNERLALQIQSDKLIRDIGELNSQKDELRKKLNETDHRKSYVNKNRLQELEKQLKEEKCKYNFLKDRLSRVSDQLKVNADHESQLNAALEQSRSNSRCLERNVQQLKDQNQQLNTEIEKKFNEFSELIRVNTTHLEEIEETREKLQAEKEDLEKRLDELSSNYNESIKNMRKEMNMQIAKVIENEKKYDDEKEERLKLADELIESELRYKELYKQLQEKELKLGKSMEYWRELEVMKHRLNEANTEIEKYREQFVCKEEYTSELEKKVDLLEQQRHESENKMVSYEEKLTSIKQDLARLQEDFGEFENLRQLHDMINQQRAKLLEATRQNGELAEALQNKDLQLEQHLESIADQEHEIEQRDGIIKVLSEKEGEHSNIIKLLRNNLELRTQADHDLNQQLSKKNSEIDTLITNLEKGKQQIIQLEKIILALEDQARKASAQRQKDQEKVKYLESKLNDLEIFHKENKRNIETPAENLDNIIKILEDELISPLNPMLGYHDEAYRGRKKICGNKKMSNKIEHYDPVHLDSKNNVDIYDEKIPTKIVMDYGNNIESFSKNINNEVRCGTNMQTQKYANAPELDINICDTRPTSDNPAKVKRKELYPTRNINFLTPIQLQNDKKCFKLLKIAGHKLIP